MNIDAKYAVYKVNETFLDSLYKDIVTFGFLAFCIYISQDSTWWTLVTGVMFLVFAFGKIAVLLKRNRHEFRTKAELQKWVDAQEGS